MDAEHLHGLMFDTLQSLPPPDFSDAPLENRDLQLVFRHDCQSLGCLDSQCVLCEHNPHRRCTVNFAQKYLVHDILRAKCDAPIRVEVIDRNTGQPVGDNLPSLSLELCILDGNQYDQRCGDMVDEERPEDIEACILRLNNKGNPLLVPGAGGSHNADNKVSVPMVSGYAMLPDIYVSDSSEALLSGRKPPFRLLARAIVTDSSSSESEPPVPIRLAVSEGFVVATRRTRTAGKVDIPNVDDHVGKLEHMGRETIKKLQDIRGSALAVGIDIHVPDNRIVKVGEFRKLALLAEADGHLRQKLQQVLKLSKEKWEEARDHAMRAVVADNRMRIWYADKSEMNMGLLFSCRLGNIELERPVGLLTKTTSSSGQTAMEATLMAQQTPAQRDQVRRLQPRAEAAWWQPGHPGWAIYPVDSDQFLSSGTLETMAPTYFEPPQVPLLANMGGGSATVSQGPIPSVFGPFIGTTQTSQSGMNTSSGFIQGFEGIPGIPANSPWAAMAGPIVQGNKGSMTAAAGGAAAQKAYESGRKEEKTEDGGANQAKTPFAFSTEQGNNVGELQAGSNIMPNYASNAAGAPGQFAQTTQAQAIPPSVTQEARDTSRAPDVANVSTTSAFAVAPPTVSGKMEGAPSFNFGNLQAMLGPDFKLPLSMSGLPSLASGDLEAILASYGSDTLGTTGRLPSVMLGKATSLEIPQNPAAQVNGNDKPVGANDDLYRKNSGLESMQSIEQALDGVREKGGAGKAGAGGGQTADANAAMDAAIAAVERSSKEQLSGHKRK